MKAKDWLRNNNSRSKPRSLSEVPRGTLSVSAVTVGSVARSRQGAWGMKTFRCCRGKLVFQLTETKASHSPLPSPVPPSLLSLVLSVQESLASSLGCGYSFLHVCVLPQRSTVLRNPKTCSWGQKPGKKPVFSEMVQTSCTAC